jgi:predicted nucleic acid-binding protein
VRCFFDTNILVYAFLESEKRDAALELVSNGGVISAQVLNEFSNVALRKLNRSWDETASAIAILRLRFPEIAPLTTETHTAAMSLVRAHKFNFHDALIVSSALLTQCDVLFSEDLQNGRKIGGLTIRNPFTPQ